MNYAVLYNLKPGDSIIEPLFRTGFSKHFAIYLGKDSQGNEFVAENHWINGVTITLATRYFSSVKRIVRIERFSGSELERTKALQRAFNLAGKPYNLITYNCEHFATEVQKGKPSSNQVTNFAVLFILFMIGLYYKNNASTYRRRYGTR
ncbi:lecithin retinol acyltransferase family protein [Daejeonella lutea]|uniref:Lecithin retinol acyltransferase n=1 Tax=Daejeonella lutea TaxID=572036 RepID=A0A1T5CXI2_9SPHI|nr:lecithin retinol acyltransferase family protein [Daejeonella lutea]SKB64057.1 Lecithin retinol acyltransferase [Daejeonella lutea]